MVSATNPLLGERVYNSDHQERNFTTPGMLVLNLTLS
jgi:hypothetical protein